MVALQAATLRILERLAAADCAVETALLAEPPPADGSNASPALQLRPLADGLAAMPYPLAPAEAASVRVYCAAMVRGKPGGTPSLLAVLRARLAHTTADAPLPGGDAGVLDVLALATLTRCTLEHLVREAPRSPGEWDGLLAPAVGSAAGAGRAGAVDDLLEFVAQCPVDCSDARYYLLAEVLTSLLLLASARTKGDAEAVFARAFLSSRHATEACGRLLSHLVTREAGTAPPPPSTMMRKITSLASALFSVSSSLFALVASPDADADPTSAEAAAAAAAAAGERSDDVVGAAAGAAATVDAVAERALLLLLALSQLNVGAASRTLPEPEPEPEPNVFLGGLCTVGNSTGSEQLAAISYHDVYRRAGIWLSDSRGAIWAYLLVHRHSALRKHLLARADLDVWLVPLLRQLYVLSEPPPRQAQADDAAGPAGSAQAAARDAASSGDVPTQALPS